MNQDDGMFLCASRYENIIHFICNYLCKIDDIAFSIVTDDEKYYIMVCKDKYEEGIKKMWLLSSESEVKGIRFNNNNLTNWYFSSASLLKDLVWFDVNGNPCSFDERIIAKCKSNMKLYDCHGKFNEELKDYLNDLSVYLISCDIFTDFNLFRYENVENELLLFMRSVCNDYCSDAFYNFVSEFGTGPFTDIEFMDEIGRVIDKKKKKKM